MAHEKLKASVQVLSSFYHRFGAAPRPGEVATCLAESLPEIVSAMRKAKFDPLVQITLSDKMNSTSGDTFFNIISRLEKDYAEEISKNDGAKASLDEFKKTCLYLISFRINDMGWPAQGFEGDKKKGVTTRTDVKPYLSLAVVDPANKEAYGAFEEKLSQLNSMLSRDLGRDVNIEIVDSSRTNAAGMPLKTARMDLGEFLPLASKQSNKEPIPKIGRKNSLM